MVIIGAYVCSNGIFGTILTGNNVISARRQSAPWYLSQPWAHTYLCQLCNCHHPKITGNLQIYLNTWEYFPIN